MRPFITTSTVFAAAISGVAAQDQQNGNVTGALGDAQPVTDNPAGAAYMATLPDTPYDKAAYPSGGNVKGSVQAISVPNGNGVAFHVTFSNLPSDGGPFLYHIHDQPVPDDGNCSLTLGHLDPYQRGETPPCDPSAPWRCQVGDLAGKYGKVSVDGGADATFTATYVDPYASTKEGIGAFFGNRSIVFHYGNKTRITCANFVAAEPGGGSTSCPGYNASSTTYPGSQPTGQPTSSTTGYPTSTPTTSAPGPFVTAAGHVNAAKRLVALGAAALVVFLL